MAHGSQGLGRDLGRWTRNASVGLVRCRRSAGNALNLPFQDRLLPPMQRVSKWQAISVTQGDISRDASWVHDAHIADYARQLVELCDHQWLTTIFQFCGPLARSPESLTGSMPTKGT